MIYLTGHGAFANTFSKLHTSTIISIRNTDIFPQNVRVIHNSADINCISSEENVSNFIKLIRLSKNNKIILISSMSVLSKFLTPYAESKLICEKLANKLGCAIVRFSTIFYEDPKRDALSKMIYDAKTKGVITIYGKGESCRDFMPIEIACEEVYKINNGTHTVASGVKTSFIECANYVAKETGAKIFYNGKEEKETIVDFDCYVKFDLKRYIKRYLNKLC